MLDDSPEASAREAVTSVQDDRVRYIAREVPSKGRPAVVRNEGARLAQGGYLHFLDDDDLLEPGALRCLKSALEGRPEVGMAFGVITPFGDNAEELRQQTAFFEEAARAARALRDPRQLVANLMFHSPVLVNSACMARRDAFMEVGGYDLEMPVCEDLELWARIAQRCGFVFVDCPVMRYRTGAPSLMHAPTVQEKLLTSYDHWYAKYRLEHGALGFLAFKLVFKMWARCWPRSPWVKWDSPG